MGNLYKYAEHDYLSFMCFYHPKPSTSAGITKQQTTGIFSNKPKHLSSLHDSIIFLMNKAEAPKELVVPEQ